MIQAPSRVIRPEELLGLVGQRRMIAETTGPETGESLRCEKTNTEAPRKWERVTVVRYYFRDLEGNRPENHPKVTYTERGKVVPAVGLVFVKYNGELWRITEIILHTRGKGRAVLVPYKGRANDTCSVTFSTLRHSYWVWDEYA